jgi:hypothetical protein
MFKGFEGDLWKKFKWQRFIEEGKEYTSGYEDIGT